jgi:DNA-binding transcriptional ArsR family regulator
MSKRVDLIIHPVRFRVLQTLSHEQLTTQEISDRLPDVPKSSIYRHLKLLLDNEVVAVADTRLVKGIQEKTYRVAQSLHLNADDMAGLSADEHLNYFTNSLLTLLRDFSNYLTATEETKGEIDMLADRVGYTEVKFYANLEELTQFLMALNQAILPLMQNEAGNGRFLYKLATIAHPERTPKGKKS